LGLRRKEIEILKTKKLEIKNKCLKNPSLWEGFRMGL
jgi:hypothetical protein